MRLVGRIAAALFGLPLLLAGAFGLLAAYGGDTQLAYDFRSLLQDVVKAQKGGALACHCGVVTYLTRMIGTSEPLVPVLLPQLDVLP